MQKLSIGIIGAGFAGLGAAYYLSQSGHDVTVIETDSNPGGLAAGFKPKGWKWSLEKHYHHLFLTDYSIRELARKINYQLIIKRPKTSTYYKGSIKQIDSPVNLLKFEHLSFVSRVRTGFILLVLKLIPFLKVMESISAEKFIKNSMGQESWNVLWGPLLTKKFGRFSKVIPSSWFWARVKTRTSSLAYPKGGFLTFAWAIVKKIEKKKGKVLFNEPVQSISRNNKGKVVVKTKNGQVFYFDKVICTLPVFSFKKIVKKLPKNFYKKTESLRGLGAINLVLVLKNKVLPDDTYWLNINEDKYPFLCMVEHTNFMDYKKYGKKRLLYVGNYLETTHKYFSYSEKELLDEYMPSMREMIPSLKRSDIKKAYVFKAPFAQPIITKNYSKKLPPFKTPIDGLYLANIQQVYPWDRGTNYAVALGKEVADIILK